MIPRSLSASALHVAELCLARWKAENFDRVPSVGGVAANIGTAVHGGLEYFVKEVCIEKTLNWDWHHLLQFYKISYIETFDTANFESDAFKDGAEMSKRWFDRSGELMDTKILSCEIKENFTIPSTAGDIPFNYIWDRSDQLDDETYRVVDYKTVRLPVSPEEMKRRIQPRAYALAAQIKWPHAKRIWVEYDLLRHERVGAVFTRDENKATWSYLKASAERIIATDPFKVPETLNPECRWCVRKASCATLNAAVAGGSVFAVTPEEAVGRKLKIASQMSALTALDAELDQILLEEAKKRDEISWDTPQGHVDITASRRRAVNSNAVAHLVGPALTAKYGTFTLASVDKLLKSGELEADTASQLKRLITVKWGEPTSKIRPVSPLEEDD